MSFDQMYDEMLHEEFSSRGKHEAKAAFQRIVAAADADPELVQSTSRGRHAAAEEPAAEQLSVFQRYRTAALVGAGGLACATAGALLGGLGGYFTISPAAAHSVASPTITQDLPLAQAVGQAAHNASGSDLGTSAVAAADFSRVSGSLTQGIAPFATLTTDPLANLPVTGATSVFGGSSGGTGTGSVGNGTVTGGDNSGSAGGGLTGCASSSDLGLSCILSNLSGTLSNLGSLTGGNPTGELGGLMPSLDGVVSDVTGTLANLNSLLPIASLPLPTGSLPTTVLAGLGGTGGGVTSAPATGGIGSGSSDPVESALAPVLNDVGSVASGLGGLGSTTPSIPSLPLPSSSGSTLPSLPLSSAAATTASPTSGTGGSSGSSTSGSQTINVPLPLPVSSPTVTIGGLSVGINSSGSNSGLTLTLP